MNLAMWRKALQVIPEVSKAEWDQLDVISKWLISTRAAVLIMTFISAALAGLFAWRDHAFNWLAWLALTFGLIMAHASNNIFNDFTDYIRGVDQGNYYRNVYGAQPIASGLMTRRQHLAYFIVTGFLAVSAGLYLILKNANDPLVWLLLGLGAFFVLFYTWPLKYIALGEVAVLLVWGPLMIGGGYYALTQRWNWQVVLAGLPYALGVTTVIFGKHIDKLKVDRAKRIFTLPVALGEKLSRWVVLALMLIPYGLTAYLIFAKFFTPVMAVVLFALPTFLRVYPAFLQPKPETPPAGQAGWPLYFVGYAFYNNRAFGLYFMLGLLLDTLLRLLPATQNFWR
ncbi:MAG: prenyltransferase [Anaerolineales bacterium]|nr:prenyltransferase [Anaerolineales bacterium]